MSMRPLAMYIAGCLAAVATTATVTAIPAHAADSYVAIYYSPEEEVYGWANNRATRGQAETAAWEQCKSYGGRNCQLVVWAANGCAALVTADDGTWAGYYAATTAEAESLALAHNGGRGTVLVSKCSS